MLQFLITKLRKLESGVLFVALILLFSMGRLFAGWQAEARLSNPEAVVHKPSAVGGIGSWSSLGPGNIGGRVLAILIHPTSPSTMWVGSAGGGIWKSTDSGISWQKVNPN